MRTERRCRLISAATATVLSIVQAPVALAAPASAADSVRASASSAGKPLGKQYYFTWAQVPSDEWRHPVGPCVQMDDSVRSGLRDCRPLGTGQLCDSTFTVELNSGPQRHRFYLAHEVFTTQAACTARRNQALQQ